MVPTVMHYYLAIGQFDKN